MVREVSFSGRAERESESVGGYICAFLSKSMRPDQLSSRIVKEAGGREGGQRTERSGSN